MYLVEARDDEWSDWFPVQRFRYACDVRYWLARFRSRYHDVVVSRV